MRLDDEHEQDGGAGRLAVSFEHDYGGFVPFGMRGIGWDAVEPVAARERCEPRRWFNRDGERCHGTVNGVRGTAKTCKRPNCEACAWSNALKRTYRRFTPNVAPSARLWMVTLTMNATTDAGEARRAVLNLLKGFAKVMDNGFRKSIDGGCRGLHVPYGCDGWQPHVHAVIQADRIDTIELGKAWAKATGEKLHVFVKPVGWKWADRRNVLKYSLGPQFDGIDTDDRQAELGTILAGVRGFAAFGSWPKFKDVKRQPHAEPASSHLSITSETNPGTNPLVDDEPVASSARLPVSVTSIASKASVPSTVPQGQIFDAHSPVTQSAVPADAHFPQARPQTHADRPLEITPIVSPVCHVDQPSAGLPVDEVRTSPAAARPAAATGRVAGDRIHA